MIKLRHILNEKMNLDDNFIWMYHGGRKWQPYEAQVKPAKKGRYEAGPGIYLTNHYDTALKYARGSNIVSLIGVSKDLTFSNDVDIDVGDIEQFIKTYIGPKNRKDMMNDVLRYTERTNRSTYPSEFLINLSVNYEIGGKQLSYLLNFLVDNGIDCTLTSKPGNQDEIWLVVHNPSVIKKVIHTKPSDISVDDYVLKPSFRHNSRT